MEVSFTYVDLIDRARKYLTMTKTTKNNKARRKPSSRY
jgi:hypothetical protein